MAAAALLCCALGARADLLTITLHNPNLNVVPGGPAAVCYGWVTTTYTGTIGVGPDSYYGTTINKGPLFDSAGLTLDEIDYFWSSADQITQPSQTWFGPLFSVAADIATPQDAYINNTFGISGLTDSYEDFSGSATFQVNVTPEPPIGVLYALGVGLAPLAGLARARWRARKRRTAA